ncbi:hypothetical protein [Streptomyces lavendulae]|uniref:hypothetical protein n=1 Tax=Streptomyces lavendulae TaxID=1914 RepID=UPI002556237B|nr:hypothetical protein [Streptomyces lavendulae]
MPHTVDPPFSPPAPATAKPLPAWRDWDPQHVGVLRVAGAAAVVSCLNLLIG